MRDIRSPRSQKNGVLACSGRVLPVGQAVVAAAAFSLLLAGTNAINPLLPTYRAEFRFGALLVSLTFVSYVAALVGALIVAARSNVARHAPHLLLSALAAALLSDVLLSHPSLATILTGRIVAGGAGGLGTGSAAALVVAAIGSRGRSLSSVGNLIGAVIGTAGSQLLVLHLGSIAAKIVFELHAGLVFLALVLSALILFWNRELNRDAFKPHDPGRDRRVVLSRSDKIFVAIGSIGWVALSLGVVFGSSLFAALGMWKASAIGPLLMLVTSAALQLSSQTIGRIFPRSSGLGLIALGCVGIGGGVIFHTQIIALVSFALLGAGVGVSYRLNLVMLSRGASPARQGSLSSTYAAISYAMGAAVVLGTGGLGHTVGLSSAAITALGLTAVAAAVGLPFAPRLEALDS